jgi:ATP-binding cassette subfamily C (CFTR/MRP) protein 10
MMAAKDKRVRLMNELLGGIRVVKFYAWEKHFRRRIKQLRADELKALKARKYLDALCVYFWATTPVLVAILTFATFVLMGGTLTSAKVFTCMALFNMLISPLNAFPWVIGGLVEAWVSLKRVRKLIQVSNHCNFISAKRIVTFKKFD